MPRRPPGPASPAEHLLLVPDTPAGAVPWPDGRPRRGRATSRSRWSRRRARTTQRLRAAGAERRDDMRAGRHSGGRARPGGRPRLAGRQGGARPRRGARAGPVRRPAQGRVARAPARDRRPDRHLPGRERLRRARERAPRWSGWRGWSATRPRRARRDPGRARRTRWRARTREPGAMPSRRSPAGRRRGPRRCRRGRAGGRRAATVGALRTQYLELSAAEVAELATRPGGGGDRAGRRCRRRATSAPPRSWPATSPRRPSPQPSGPGYLAWHDAQLPRPASTVRRSTSPTPASTTARLRPSTPTSTSSDRRRIPERVDYQADYTCAADGVDLDTDARDCSGPRHQRGLDRGRLQRRARARRTRTPPASTTASASRRWRGSARRRCSKLRTTTARRELAPDTPSPRPSVPIGRTPTPAAPASRTTRGAPAPALAAGATYSGALASSSTSSCATPSRAPPATRSWSRCSPPATTGAVAASTRVRSTAEAHREERDHRRGVRRRARDRRRTAAATADASADNARDIADFSSRGPTDDGRLKPDLVAPGTHVTGARPLRRATTTAAAPATRSSLGRPAIRSCRARRRRRPQVSGAAALVRDWYERQRRASAPSPAMTKALLINTASDLPAAKEGRAIAAAEHRPGLGEGERRGGLRLDRARVLRPAARRPARRRRDDTVVRAFNVQDTRSR